jgi:hypothetical protein
MTKTRRIDRLRGLLISIFWGLNATLLAATTAWILFDPGAAQVIEAQLARLDLSSEADSPTIRNWAPLRGRLLALQAAAACAAISLIGLLAGLFVGAPRHRQIRSWLAVMFLVGGWLTLAIKWQDARWAGQWMRARSNVAGMERVAASLREAWPTEDGEHCDLGPFMAYPREDPMTLILLSSPTVPGGSFAFSAVERSDAGGLRFQLAGADRDAWLEWHPPGHLPASFIGGLQDGHEILRFAKCGDGWFLVAYRTKKVSR